MRPSAPSLFRLTLISIAKQREPMRTEVPGQPRDRRSCDRYEKFELTST